MTSSRRSSLAVLAILALAAMSPFLVSEIPSAAALTPAAAQCTLVCGSIGVHFTVASAGDLIVVGADSVNSGSKIEMTVSDGVNTYHNYTDTWNGALCAASFNCYARIFIATASAAGSVTVTVTGSAGTGYLTVEAYDVAGYTLTGAIGGADLFDSVGAASINCPSGYCLFNTAVWTDPRLVIVSFASPSAGGSASATSPWSVDGPAPGTVASQSSSAVGTSAGLCEYNSPQCALGGLTYANGANGFGVAGVVLEASSGGGGFSCPLGYTFVNGVCQTGGGPSSSDPGRIVLTPGIPEYYGYGLGGENAVVTNFSAYFRFVNSSASVVTIYLFIATSNGFYGLPSPTNPAPVVWGRSFSVANNSLNFKLSVVPNVAAAAGSHIWFGVATVNSGVALENSSFPSVLKDTVDPVPPTQLTSAVSAAGGPYMWITVSLSPQTSTTSSTSSGGGCNVIFCIQPGISCPGSGGSVAAYAAGFLFGSCVAAGWVLVLTLCVSFFALVAVVVTKTKSRGVPALVYLFPWLVGFFIGTAFGWLDPIVGVLILLGLGSLGALGIRAKI